MLLIYVEHTRTGRPDGQSTPLRYLSLILSRIGTETRPRIRLALSSDLCPTTTCQPNEDLQIRYKLDNQHFIRLRTSIGEQQRTPITEHGALLTRDQEDQLRQGRKLWF